MSFHDSMVSDNTARNVWYAEELITPSCITGLNTGSEAENLYSNVNQVAFSADPPHCQEALGMFDCLPHQTLSLVVQIYLG